MRNLSRKEFISLSAISSLTIPFLASRAMGNSLKSIENSDSHSVVGSYSDTLGFQVFTLRDMLVDNAPGLFKSLAGAGIKTIEFFDPATLNNYVPIVNDLGMKSLATHFLPGYITNNWDYAKKHNFTPPPNYTLDNVIEDCHKNGIKYLGIAIMFPEDREKLDDYKRFAEKSNIAGEKCKAAGIQLYYHNHSFEFEPKEGSLPYVEMLKIFDPQLVKIELDVFWVTVGGQNPIYWLQKVSDRLLFLHMKDLKRGSHLGHFDTNIPRDSFVELGTGMVDYKNILAECRRLQVEYAFIDQDFTQLNDKISSVKMNCDYIKSLGI